MWHVVVDKFCSDPSPENRVWTVSKDPARPGWNTDSGFPGYGLTKAEAEELVSRNRRIERAQIEAIVSDSVRQGREGALNAAVKICEDVVNGAGDAVDCLKRLRLFQHEMNSGHHD